MTGNVNSISTTPGPDNSCGVERMTESIIVAIVTGVLTLFGTVITVLANGMKTRKDFEIRQAVQNEKIEELTREVREHNGFARRLPVLEEQIKVANHRIADLEKKGEGK